MAIRVFPVGMTGRPHYADDFGYVRPGGTHAHQGIDIFADLGAPIVAVDDGSVRFAEDPTGGHAFYLTARDGVVYYGAHLNSFEGSGRAVSAGETIGYVGQTGNAAGTSPHLHFEEHPGAGIAAVDPYPELFALAPSSAQSGPPGTAGGVPLALAGKALLSAWHHRHPASSPPASLAFPFAWAIAAEGSFTPPYARTNNWGSYHATSSWAARHAKDVGYGMVAFLDHDPAAFVSRMRVYPSQTIGAEEYLALVEADVGDLGAVEDAETYVRFLYAHTYYVGFHTPRSSSADMTSALRAGNLDAILTDADRANIADGVASVNRGLHTATATLAKAPSSPGDPDAMSAGPPFAPLALRLTPSSAYAPHTLEHAQKLLGARASSPPAGGISLEEALHAPDGDGVWMFGPGRIKPPAPAEVVDTFERVAGAAVGLGVTILGVGVALTVGKG